MSVFEKNEGNQRDILQNALLVYLRQEITLFQNLLSNISQQEYTLLTGNLSLREELLSAYKKLEKEQKKWTKERSLRMKQLFEIASLTEGNSSLETLFDSSNEDHWEILSLFQNLNILTDKVESQKERNKVLFKMIQKGGSMSQSTGGLKTKPLYVEKKKKKPLLITIEYPEENSRL